MIRVFTLFDLLWFLLSAFGKMSVTVMRSRYFSLLTLLCVCVLTVVLSILLVHPCIQTSRLRNTYILEGLTYQSQDIYNRLSDTRAQDALLRHMPPLTVHYMWCRKSHFEFKHYLSLLSVAKVLKPDQIVFHYLEMPQKDDHGYFTWFDDLQREVPMLSFKQLQDVTLCGYHFTKGLVANQDFAIADGVFMMEDIAIANLSREDFYQFTDVKKYSRMNCQDGIGGVCSGGGRKPSQMFLVPQSEPYVIVKEKNKVLFQCPTITTFNKASTTLHCLQLSQRLFPSNIWILNKTFDRFARRIVYNTPHPVIPLGNASQSAPPIAHILKFDEGDVSPLCFASIHSAFVNGQLEHVYVHGPMEGLNTDPLWARLVRQHSLTHIPTPTLGRGSSVHRQLLYGLQVLIQFGGALFRCDTVVLKSLQPLLSYPAVSSVRKTRFRIVHHHVDFSLMLAQPGSSYLQTLIPVFKQLLEIDSDRSFGAVGFHTYEQYPASVKMNANLVGRLKCQAAKCQPADGQMDVRQSYAVKFSWSKDSPPNTLQELAGVGSPVNSLVLSLVGGTLDS